MSDQSFDHISCDAHQVCSISVDLVASIVGCIEFLVRVVVGGACVMVLYVIRVLCVRALCVLCDLCDHCALGYRVFSCEAQGSINSCMEKRGRSRSPARRPSKRPHYEDRRNNRWEAIKAMKAAVTKLADEQSASLDKHIAALADALNRDCAEDYRFQDAAVDAIIECAVHFPAKGCIYSVLVGLVNAHNQRFATTLVRKALQELEKYLTHLPPAHTKLRLLVRPSNLTCSLTLHRIAEILRRTLQLVCFASFRYRSHSAKLFRKIESRKKQHDSRKAYFALICASFHITNSRQFFIFLHLLIFGSLQRKSSRLTLIHSILKNSL
jgi:hypothetical protein